MKVLWSAGVVAVVVGSLAGMFVLARVMNGPMTSVSPAVGYATVQGHDAVLVAYQRSGGQVPKPFGFDDQWQERLAAVSLGTGELLWDVKLHGHTRPNRAVLAVADGLAYVATDYGLSIVATEDGGILVDGDRIPGLGGDYAQAYTAYNVDPRLGAVVALTHSGEVVQIPLGTTDAAPAPHDVAEAWRGTLIDDWSPTRDPNFSISGVDPAAQSRSVALPDGDTLTFAKPYTQETARLVRGDRILATVAGLTQAELVFDIVRTPVALATAEQLKEGTDTFTKHHSAALPLGVAHGMALVYGQDADAPGVYELRLFDIDTGETLAVVDQIGGYLRATATPGGDILVVAAAEDSSLDTDRLIVFRPDGRTTITQIGDTDFWGHARANVTTP